MCEVYGCIQVVCDFTTHPCADEWDSDVDTETSDADSFFSDDDNDDNCFDDDLWDVFGKCQVQESEGEWCDCTIFTLKSSKSAPGSDVCLYFGGDEYEGLVPDTYSMDKDDNFMIQTEIKL